MLTVVAVLALWFLASVAFGVLVGGVVRLRGRDRSFEAGRVHSPDLAAPALSASVS